MAMFIKIKNGAPEDYTMAQLQRDNPNTSFPSDLTSEVLASYGVYRVKRTAQPSHNQNTQKVVPAAPVLQGNEWVQQWLVVSLPTEAIRSSRQAAYQAEADPLFFKWQAGEATKEEWLAKRSEIRLRFPYEE